jgi:hypothetical protein
MKNEFVLKIHNSFNDLFKLVDFLLFFFWKDVIGFKNFNDGLVDMPERSWQPGFNIGFIHYVVL